MSHTHSIHKYIHAFETHINKDNKKKISIVLHRISCIDGGLDDIWDLCVYKCFTYYALYSDDCFRYIQQHIHFRSYTDIKKQIVIKGLIEHIQNTEKTNEITDLLTSPGENEIVKNIQNIHTMKHKEYSSIWKSIFYKELTTWKDNHIYLLANELRNLNYVQLLMLIAYKKHYVINPQIECHTE